VCLRACALLRAQGRPGSRGRRLPCAYAFSYAPPYCTTRRRFICFTTSPPLSAVRSVPVCVCNSFFQRGTLRLFPSMPMWQDSFFSGAGGGGGGVARRHATQHPPCAPLRTRGRYHRADTRGDVLKRSSGTWRICEHLGPISAACLGTIPAKR
jgi:hypothetical protein